MFKKIKADKDLIKSYETKIIGYETKIIGYEKNIKDLNNLNIEQNKLIESQNFMLKESFVENELLKQEKEKIKKELLTVRGTNGGYAASSAKLKIEVENLNKKVEQLESDKAILNKENKNNKKYIKACEKKIKDLTKDKNDQNNIIQSLNEELKKIKNKKPAPTIEELKADILFHGRRKK